MNTPGRPSPHLPVVTGVDLQWQAQMEVVWNGRAGHYLLADRPTTAWQTIWGPYVQDEPGLGLLQRRLRTTVSGSSWRDTGGRHVTPRRRAR